MGVVTPARTPRTLAEWIDARRIDLGLDTVRFAEAIGKSRQWFLDLRSGKSVNPRATTRRAIEKALDWERGSVDSILDGGQPTELQDPQDAVARMSVTELADTFVELARDHTDQDVLEVMSRVMRLRSRGSRDGTNQAG